jgi:hypothetical protein
MKHPLLTCLFAGSTLVASAQTPTAKSPPKGIEIPASDRESLRGAASLLQSELAEVSAGRLAPQLRDRLPDVEIFPIAILRALELDGFYDLKQVASARALLQEGTVRLEALRRGETPWTVAKGPVVRGFRSRIDGSVQPYGVIVPEEATKGARRLDVWLHGRNDKLTELAFLSERSRSKGEFTPPGTVVLHPYGRFCNGFKFAGETDVLEALADAQAQYGTSPRHVAIRGFSMGGAGCWHLAGHYTSLWAVAAPGAGFAETANYAKVFAPEKPVPPWWEQTLWRLYDVPGYAANFANRPTFAYSGEIDPQKQAADVMVAAAAAEGVTIPHFIGPKTAHKYHPETKLALAAKVDAAAEAGAPEAPEEVRLSTFTLRYNRMDWVEITGLQNHWEQSSVRAKHVGKGSLTVETKGVESLVLTPPADWVGQTGWKVVCDGQPLGATPAGGPLRLEKHGTRWALAKGAPTGLRKQHGLQGPVDDAFQEPFVFVRPTGKALHPQADAWARSEMDRALAQWKKVFRGDVRVVTDDALTPELIATHHIVLWGDPGSNKVLARLLSPSEKQSHSLPLRWDAKELRLGTSVYPAASHAPILIYPNPLSPTRYVVLNSSFTFRQGSDTTNALQTPKLPDWAVVDLATPPGLLLPGAVPNAGFFNEAWQLPE